MNYKKLGVIAMSLSFGLSTSMANESVAEMVEEENSDPYAEELRLIEPEGNEVGGNTYYGENAGAALTSGSSNSFFGSIAGENATTGSNNTCIGSRSCRNLTTGGQNTTLGYEAGGAGWNNTLIGVAAGYFTSGTYNVLLGSYAGQEIRTGSKNVILGHSAATFGSATLSNTVLIGYYAGSNLDRNNTLIIENSSSNSPLIYGEFDNDLVRINGNLEATFNGADTANNHNLLVLDVNNTGAGASDVGFSLENKETEFKWAFRTYTPGEGFTATKIGTGGTEFEVGNIGTTTGTTVVKMGGVTVFEAGHLVTASSRELKTDIKPLDTQAALDAFHKLQPVSYAYKSHKDEAVVGFIAEDVPELVAMPSGKSIDSTEIVAVLTSVLAETRAEAVVMKTEMKVKDVEIAEMKVEIEQLKTMQKKVAMMESILTNLALNTSDTDKSIVSINFK